MTAVVSEWWFERVRGGWSRIKCRTFDRHDVFCRGRIDHTPDQRRRTR